MGSRMARFFGGHDLSAGWVSEWRVVLGTRLLAGMLGAQGGLPLLTTGPDPTTEAPPQGQFPIGQPAKGQVPPEPKDHRVSPREDLGLPLGSIPHLRPGPSEFKNLALTP